MPSGRHSRSFTNAKRKKLKVIYSVPAKVIHQCQAEDIQGHLPMPMKEIEGHFHCTRKGNSLMPSGRYSRSFINAKRKKLKIIYSVPAKVIHSCQAENIQGHLLMISGRKWKSFSRYPQRLFTNAKRKTFKVIYYWKNRCQRSWDKNFTHSRDELSWKHQNRVIFFGSGHKLIQKFTKRPIKFIVTSQSQQASHTQFKVVS